MLKIHAVGDWSEAQVEAASSDDDRRLIVPEVEALIDAAWRETMARPGVHLFDGPMCRMESWSASPEQLRITLSRTSYRAFLGTNLVHPELADRFGPAVMSDPVGVSVALESSDGWLLFGRRNGWVAYYPNRVHPFAGALEPRDAARVFDAVRRELAEELAIEPRDVGEIRCTGIVEDQALRQPELIFRATATLARQQIEAKLDREEHHATYPVAVREDTVAAALRDPALTPVGVAALLLWGRVHFGEEWFGAQRPR